MILAGLQRELKSFNYSIIIQKVVSGVDSVEGFTDEFEAVRVVRALQWSQRTVFVYVSCSTAVNA